MVIRGIFMFFWLVLCLTLCLRIMRRRRGFVGWFLGVMFLVGTVAFGQGAASLNRRFTDFYLGGQMELWQVLVDSLRKVPLDAEEERVLLFAEYGLLGADIGAKRSEAAWKNLPFFERLIQKQLATAPDNGEWHAFSAALIAYRIALEPWKAPFLSRSHTAALEKALALQPRAGLPLVEQANSWYFRPSLVGGDKAKALKAYEQAFSYYKRFEREHWMYYNVGAWLGQAYLQQGQRQKAEALYLQLLKEAPDFTWVRDELLPELQQGKNPNWHFEVE